MASNFKKDDLRRTQRLLLTPKGELFDGTTSVKALIQDISDEGLLLVSSKIYAPGQTLTLKFQVSTGNIIDCQVEVRHSSDMGTGVKLLAMNVQHRRAYEQYLQEYFSQHLGRLG
ncbi:MAG TPA: PilZ domain-containing protein [Burkholderiales bacterium]|nr:PilZ domain-containing protein [Burkholderiales bacterium]